MVPGYYPDQSTVTDYDQTPRFFYCLLAISYSPSYDSVMLWASMSLAFFGFLRLGELTCNSKFSPETHLTADDVTFLPSWENPDHMSVCIKISKTDPFTSGQTILLGKTQQPVCPVQGMKTYIAIRKRTPGPLFLYASGKPLTKNALTSETRQLLSKSGFNLSQYTGQSFRIGVATTAASVGLSPWLIKTLGRWQSDCYERYVRCPPPLIFDVPQKLVRDAYHYQVILLFSSICKVANIFHSLRFIRSFCQLTPLSSTSDQNRSSPHNFNT